MTALLSRRYRLPRGVTVDDLDLRWLSARHRDQLMANKLRVPDQANHFGYGGHPATLVSVPDGFGSPVAWIDQGMAELIWRLNRHYDIATVECCQGGGGETAYVAFASKRDVPRFQALAGGALRGEEVARAAIQAAVYFPASQLRAVTRSVRNA